MPALDQNLFTLKLKRSDEEPGSLDLVDPQGNLYYRKRLIPPNKVGEAMAAGIPFYDVWDPSSDSLLATLAANPANFGKKRTVQLYNPAADIDITFSGSLSFRWQFQWEEHTFEFKKEEIFLLRRPDPPVLVAVYEFERKTNKPDMGLIQLMDYNLARFDIEDRKGLDIVMITGLLSFQDAITGNSDSNLPSPSAELPPPSSSGMIGRVLSGHRDEPAPVLPPKDIGMQVSGLQIRSKSAPNEVVVTSMFEVEEYADYAAGLLKDPKMLYIVVRSKTAAEVPKVVAVASLVKRMRYKGGAHNEELHQYAKYEEPPSKGPKVIKLDGPSHQKDNSAKSYEPPTALSIHLSKIPMPELQPPIRPNASAASSSRTNNPSLAVPEGDKRGGFLRKGRGRTASNPPPPSAQPPASRTPPRKSPVPQSRPGAQGLAPTSAPIPRPSSAQGGRSNAPRPSSFWGFGSGGMIPPQIPPPPVSSRPPQSPPLPMPGYYPVSGQQRPPPPPPPPVGGGFWSGLLSNQPGQNQTGPQSTVQALENASAQMYERLWGPRR